MQKYKLINTKTKEEHLCDKVTIDGFDYYVSDETPKDKDKVLHKNGTIGVLTTALAIAIVEGTNEGSYVDECKKVIACNNPNIDIPKITSKIDLTKLCYYDRRNPDFSVKEEYGYDKEEVEATGNFAKKDCACDNCFYGRSRLTEQLIKYQETYPFSEEDMIELIEWMQTPAYLINIIDSSSIKTVKELFKIWKEQQPRIVYYE